jgi:small-conductance mechanosensitive channel
VDVLTSRYAVIGLLILVVFALHVSTRVWIRRREAAEEWQADARHAPVGRRRWIGLTLSAVAAPILALLWLQVLLVAARLLVPIVATQVNPTTSIGIIDWCHRLGLFALLLWLLRRLGAVTAAFVTWYATQTANTWDDVAMPIAAKAARIVLPIFGVILGAPTLAPTPALQVVVRNASSLLLVGAIGYLLFELAGTTADLLMRQHRVDVRDNLQARAVRTQIVVLRKVAQAVIVLFTLASMLMVFDSVRQLGASILASAGLAGLVVGFAAQRSIATLIAGLQIAVTQPIRVDDVLVVEGEWGRVEDITLTYVVLRTWDLRSLVLPISYFIEKPFQNWTRTSSDVLAYVMIYTDYCAPLDALRAELTRVLQQSELWDGKVNVLQVTDAREHTIEIRALASASDASRAWDLRCEVREKLIGFLQVGYPDSLPRLRLVTATQA